MPDCATCLRDKVESTRNDGISPDPNWRIHNFPQAGTASIGCVAEQQEADSCTLNHHGRLAFGRECSLRLPGPAAHSRLVVVPPAFFCLIHISNLRSGASDRTYSFRAEVTVVPGYSTNAIGRLRASSRKAASNAAVSVVVYDSPPVVFAISSSKLVC